MLKANLQTHGRLGAKILVTLVGLALVFGVATFAGPGGASKVLAQATTSTTSVGTTTVTTSGTTTTVTTTRATTAITSSGASTQVNAPSPPPPPPNAPAPAQPGLPPNGTGGLLNQQSGGSLTTLWLPLVALVLIAGGAGSYVLMRRR